MDEANEVRALVQAQRRDLEALSFDELSKLEEFRTVLVRPSGVQVTVARKTHPDGSVIVIVEGWEARFMGMSQVCTGDGFKLNASGHKSELEERDYW